MVLPVQAPLQPVNTDPAAGVAARLTTVPATNVDEQVDPQLMPAGEDDTAPLPVPASDTLSVYSGANVAPTVALELISTTQGPVPVHTDPVQPVNAYPGAGVAVRVTEVAESNNAEQVEFPEPQIIPAGLLVIVPLVVEVAVTDNVNCGVGGGPKLAVTA